jgi:hypothetical protein
LVAPLVTVDGDPPHWLDHTLIDLAQERVKEVSINPADGPGYTVTRATKDQSDFTVTGIPKGRELSNPAAADPMAGSLGSLTLDDVRPAASTTTAPTASPAPSPAVSPAPSTAVSHAAFKTFDGLDIEVSGHKDGTHTLISLTPHSNTPATQPEAQAIEARTKGWEFEIPTYKYDALFAPLENLLKKPEPAASSSKTAKGGKTPKPPATANPATSP